MKKPLLAIVLGGLLTLVGCKSQIFSPTDVNQDYLHENWQQKINLDPNQWVRSAGAWYKNGESLSPASIATIKVPNFTQLKIDGDFQVQIVGNQEKNSVYVGGPHDLVRQIVVETNQNGLYIHPAKNCKNKLSPVIVRIGTKNLRRITNMGRSSILGRYVTSDHLELINCNTGCIILQGRMTLTQVMQEGTGTITVIGACTSHLKIDVEGNGNVNVSGRVGIEEIIHHGDGVVNVIGAKSDRLCITASGCGLTTIAGCTQLQRISASGRSRVYLYSVKSNGLNINAKDQAQIGLAGDAKNMNIDLTGSAYFQGQNLHGGDIYVRTLQLSHATITADRKIFAEAKGQSSIYFYGSPNIVSRYTTQSGIVLPVWQGM